MQQTLSPHEKSCSGDEILSNEDWKTQNISLGAILLSNGDSKASSLLSNSVPEQTTLVSALYSLGHIHQKNQILSH